MCPVKKHKSFHLVWCKWKCQQVQRRGNETIPQKGKTNALFLSLLTDFSLVLLLLECKRIHTGLTGHTDILKLQWLYYIVMIEYFLNYPQQRNLEFNKNENKRARG